MKTSDVFMSFVSSSFVLRPSDSTKDKMTRDEMTRPQMTKDKATKD
jgi:hypothetical protein